MTNTRIVFFSILIAILLAILIMWCADVLAHNDGNPVAHFEPYTTQDPCWTDSCRDAEYSNGHGHINRYEDDNGNGRWDLGEENSWGYWTCGGYKYLFPETDCSEPPPPPPPPPPIIDKPEPPQRSDTSDQTVIAESLEEAKETISDEVEVPEIEEQATIETEPCVEEGVERTFYRGYTLYTPTVLPEGVVTLADLWEAYWWVGANEGAFYVVVDSEWLVYRGSGDVGTLPLSAIGAILVYQANSTLAGLQGCPVTSPAQIELKGGWNLIGFPKVPDLIERPSDLLSDIVCVVIVTQEGQFKKVFRAGDPGDAPLVNGQGLLVLAAEETTVALEVAQAPGASPAWRDPDKSSVPRPGGQVLTMAWGAIKASR